MKYPNSPYTLTERLVWFDRMCSKIRLKEAGELPPDYHEFYGTGFDGRCCRFLHVEHADVVRRVREGMEPTAILEWCYAHGRRPNDEEVFIWNMFMTKRGWNDDDSALVEAEKTRSGLGDRPEIQTLFEYYEYDEKRKP